MFRQSLDLLLSPLSGIGLISTDVFDTLLLRHPRSKRSRLVEAERRFARLLERQGITASPEDLLRVRLLAEKFAYRALEVGGGAGDIRLSDIVARQLAILGLPSDLSDRRIAIEIDVEKTSLSANDRLAMALRQQRKAGIRVIAVSDTGLCADKLRELIVHFHGSDLIDTVYSSADLQASKRSGALFCAILRGEKIAPSEMLHIGDDRLADSTVPGQLGIRTLHVPKSHIRRYGASADGARTEALRILRRRLALSRPKFPALRDRNSFGCEVFGPIVAQFCLLIWLYAIQAQAQGDYTLAFCARGGIGIRQAFEALLARLQLPLDIPRENILVSRLVAARTALETRSPAVLDELGREFEKDSFAQVAHALGGGATYELPSSWNAPFVPARFFEMLSSASGLPVLNDVIRQNQLFRRHLDMVCGPARRIILCDTGLYGSTQRLLAAGLKDRHFETIQFARCNYKRLSEDHFPDVTGLMADANLYNPLRIETVVLRYWHVVESLFEPAIPSVRHLTEQDDGTVSGNSGMIAHDAIDATAGNELLKGVLDYVDQVESGAQVMQQADVAWIRLKRAITNPSAFDRMTLNIGPRSIDFGRGESIRVLGPTGQTGLANRLIGTKSQLWREGAIARDFPRLKFALLPALELLHIARGISARLYR
ncbi:hydrolase [Rhizobium sp. R72]|uniref:hydrolase n=1 Tax=unclassified Rhizobium TaxID=2613769 RepID=UPI000B530324|nr:MULTISPECIES: hydrolase [unclassified Rhizobium]OWW00104.1 hydrolase [Rhizobium sp. R72]OWW00495.1 hydrolase [Rhizobium sp. R711]